jgi:hypothetical protein
VNISVPAEPMRIQHHQGTETPSDVLFLAGDCKHSKRGYSLLKYTKVLSSALLLVYKDSNFLRNSRFSDYFSFFIKLFRSLFVPSHHETTAL